MNAGARAQLTLQMLTLLKKKFSTLSMYDTPRQAFRIADPLAGKQFLWCFSNYLQQLESLHSENIHHHPMIIHNMDLYRIHFNPNYVVSLQIHE